MSEPSSMDEGDNGVKGDDAGSGERSGGKQMASRSGFGRSELNVVGSGVRGDGGCDDKGIPSESSTSTC